MIVTQSADMDLALPKIVKGGFYHAGQVCVSVQRVFVHESLMPEFSKRLAALAEGLKVGNPEEESTEVGPLIRHAETERVDQWVKEAIEQGARLLTGGKILSPSLYAATVLLEPPAESRISREEIFGPVIALYSFTKLTEAIDRANGLPGRMQSALFTRDLDEAQSAADLLDATGVMINEATTFRDDAMPFGGRGTAGYGMGGIGYTMREYTQEKIVIIRRAV